jgi:hypothetical protein
VLPRTLLRLTLGLLLSSVLVLLSGGDAWAAGTPEGGTLLVGSMSVSCTTPANCNQGTATVTTSGVSTGSGAPVAGALSGDPRTLANWPNVDCGQLAAINVYPAGSSASQTWTMMLSQYATGTTAYFAAWPAPSGSTCTVQALYAITPQPAPTTAPTTSAPSTTSAPPTTSAPSTTSAPPTDPGTGSGGMSCTVETPCIVKLADGQAVNVDASGLTVQALTDEQWGEIELGMSALVFFSGAAFAASWRRGRRS